MGGCGIAKWERGSPVVMLLMMEFEGSEDVTHPLLRTESGDECVSSMCPFITPLLTCPVVTMSLKVAPQTYSSLLMLIVASLLPTLFYRLTNMKEGSHILKMSHFVRKFFIFIPSLLMETDPDCDNPACR